MTVWFGQVDLDETVITLKKLGNPTRDSVLLFGVLVLLTVLLTLWAMFIRKRRRRRSHHHHHHHHSHSSSHPSTASPESESPARRKWRRRRREHRPRNPTLAETGGLPPIRDGQSPDDPAG